MTARSARFTFHYGRIQSAAVESALGKEVIGTIETTEEPLRRRTTTLDVFKLLILVI